MPKQIVQPLNPQPNKEVYKPTKHHVNREGQGYIITKFEYPEEKDGGGIYIHYLDIPYPRKGFPTMEMCETLNLLKKITLFVFSNPILLLSKTAFSTYLHLTDYLMDNPFKAYVKGHSDWYNDRYYCTFANEFKKFLEIFFTEIGVDTRLAGVFRHIMQDDDAYRYRVQDVFSETTLEWLLENPRKEIKRLMKLSIARDEKHVSARTMKFARILSWALLRPKYRKAFKKALQSVDFSKLQLDEGDKYYCLRPGYDWMGLDNNQKAMKLAQIHKGIPPRFSLLRG
jgi:hypothetical protein